MAITRNLPVDPVIRQAVQNFNYKAAGGAAVQLVPQSFVQGDKYTFNIYMPADATGWSTATGRVGFVIPPPGGAPASGVWFAIYQQEQTSGTLNAGARYIIDTYESGDDFNNVGGVNATGSVFVAAATTPTDWTNGSVLKPVTTDLDYDATAAEVKAALDAILTLFFGGTPPTYTVTGSGPQWTAVASTSIVLDTWTIGAYNLVPQCNGLVSRNQVGDGAGKVDKLTFTLRQAALASTTSFSNLTAGAYSVAVKQAGDATHNAIFDLTYTSYPYDGFITLTFSSLSAPTRTVPIAFNATAAAVQSAIEDIGGVAVGDVVVTQIVNGWRIQFTGLLANTTITTPTVDYTGVTFAVGRSATISLDTENIEAFLEDVGQRAAVLEIELTISGDISTPLQLPVTLINDGLDNATTTSTPTSTPVTTDQFAIRADITGYTGGGSTDMDSLTAGAGGTYPVGCVLLFPNLPAGDARFWIVEASTDVTTDAVFVRAQNYDGSTNAVGFRELL